MGNFVRFEENVKEKIKDTEIFPALEYDQQERGCPKDSCDMNTSLPDKEDEKAKLLIMGYSAGL